MRVDARNANHQPCAADDDSTSAERKDADTGVGLAVFAATEAAQAPYFAAPHHLQADDDVVSERLSPHHRMRNGYVFFPLSLLRDHSSL